MHPDQLEGELFLAPGYPVPPNMDYKGYHQVCIKIIFVVIVFWDWNHFSKKPGVFRDPEKSRIFYESHKIGIFCVRITYPIATSGSTQII